MSDAASYNMTRQKLRQLLTAARTNRAYTDSHLDASKYNWNQARYFDRLQMEAIAAFANNIAANVNSSLASLGRSDCSAAAADVVQRFISDTLAEFDAQAQFSASIMTDKNEQCGFITISVTSACELIAKLLADTEPKTKDQALSALENSLLQDITAALVNSMGRSLKQAGGSLLRQKSDISKTSAIFECPPNKEICRFTFNLNNQNISAVFHIVLLCPILDAIISKNQKTSATASPQNIQETILNHISPVELPISARFASVSLRLNDILALEEGDIIVLDKTISDSIDILLQNQPAFEAHLAEQAGKYALVISEPSIQSQ